MAYAEQVETTVSALQRQSATLDNRATGLVKLTSHVTVGQRIIKSGFLDRFHSGHPGITVELIMEQRALDLSKGEADIAIRGGTLDDDPALVGRKIAEVPWGIYASRAFVERHGRPSVPVDIDGFSIVELVDEIEALPAARWMKTLCADGEGRRAMQQYSQRTFGNQVWCRYRAFAGGVRGRR